MVNTSILLKLFFVLRCVPVSKRGYDCSLQGTTKSGATTKSNLSHESAESDSL